MLLCELWGRGSGPHKTPRAQVEWHFIAVGCAARVSLQVSAASGGLLPIIDELVVARHPMCAEECTAVRQNNMLMRERAVRYEAKTNNANKRETSKRQRPANGRRDLVEHVLSVPPISVNNLARKNVRDVVSCVHLTAPQLLQIRVVLHLYPPKRWTAVI